MPGDRVGSFSTFRHLPWTLAGGNTPATKVHMASRSFIRVRLKRRAPLTRGRGGGYPDAMCAAPEHRWPAGWVGLASGQATAFLGQLRRELGPGHPLAPLIARRSVRAVAVAAESDDVIFRIRGWQAPFAVVHLAWPPQDRRPALLRRLLPRPASRWVPAVVPVARLDDLAVRFA
jgi:hypothetical protein